MTRPADIERILKETRQQLKQTSDTPGLDAQVLLAHVLGKSRAWILTHPEFELAPEQSRKLEAGVKRLVSGEPLPYVLGHWEFFGLDFIVTPDVLIPRPETELLVEVALKWLEKHPSRRRAADVGTGSGCIAVALAVHTPELQMVATDISAAALQVARRNAKKHHVEDRITFVQGDLFPEDTPRFDMICANLPYIPTESLKKLSVYQSEPSLALEGGPQGLALIRRLLQSGSDRLATSGLMLLEIEASQGESAAAEARANLPAASIEVMADLAGRDRVLKIEC
jgi:release factor glutamine methyltransferase